MKPTKILNILVACEESQRECFEFRILGHRAFSCDIQPCRKNGYPGWHINQDVTALLNKGPYDFITQDGLSHHIEQWDLIVAHPPCTYLCKVSSVHLISHKKPLQKTPPEKWVYDNKQKYWINLDRMKKQKEARDFFYQCLDAKAKYVAVENPLPMKRAGLPKPTCYICPSWFGEKYTKKTLWWLKNLPPVMPTLINPYAIKDFIRHSRGKYRSVTFKGCAAACAQQWSQFILNEYEQTMHQH